MKAKTSYSFEGQDLIASTILRKIKKGFYIDVGCNHPIRINDTYKFYNSGWNGILVEPLKNFNKLYKKYRKKDVYYNCLVGLKKKYNLCVFEQSGLSSNHPPTIRRYKKRFKSVGNLNIEAKKLSEIIEDYRTKKKIKPKINLIKIDIEGNEMDVLKSLDLKKYLPDLLQIELKNFNLNKIDNKIHNYLVSNNYRLVCKSLLDTFYVYKKSKYVTYLPKKLYR